MHCLVRTYRVNGDGSRAFPAERSLETGPPKVLLECCSGRGLEMSAHSTVFDSLPMTSISVSNVAGSTHIWTHSYLPIRLPISRSRHDICLSMTQLSSRGPRRFLQRPRERGIGYLHLLTCYHYQAFHSTPLNSQDVDSLLL